MRDTLTKKEVQEIIAAEINPVKFDIQNLKIDVVNIKSDVAELKVDVAELKVDVAELKVDVAELKVDVAELKVDVAELKVDVSQLKVDVAELKVDMIIVKSDIKEIRGMFADQTAMLLGAMNDIYEKSKKETSELVMGLIESHKDEMRVYGDMYSENRGDIKNGLENYRSLDIRVTKLEALAA